MATFLKSIADFFSSSVSLRDYSKSLVNNDKYKGKVKVLVEIFQATNPNYKSPKISSGDFFTDGEGVCHGMCLSWFRDNHLLNGGTAFREMVDSNWNHFIAWQCEIDSRRSECGHLKELNSQATQKSRAIHMNIQQLLAEIDSIAKRCLELKAKGKLSDAESKEIPLLIQRSSSANSKLDDAQIALTQNKKTIDLATAKLDKIQNSIREMVAAAVYDRPEDFNQMQELASDIPMSSLTALLQRYAKAPGLYMIEMEAGASKHAVAIQSWSRFMDPNSCEYAFQDETTMRDFIAEYFKAVYGTQYQTVKLWSFAPPTPRISMPSASLYVPSMGGDSAMAALLEDTIL